MEQTTCISLGDVIPSPSWLLEIDQVLIPLKPCNICGVLTTFDPLKRTWCSYCFADIIDELLTKRGVIRNMDLEQEKVELLRKRKELLAEFGRIETRIKQICSQQEGMGNEQITIIHHCNCGFSTPSYVGLAEHIADYPASSEHFILNKGEKKKEIQLERELKGKTGFEIL